MQKNSKKKVIIIIILLLLILAGGIYYWIHRTRGTINQSYRVNESATLNDAAKLYESQILHHPLTASANSPVTVNKYYLMTIDKKQQVYAQINLNGKLYYVNAKNLNLTVSNRVNQYLAHLGYPHTQVTNQTSSNFVKRDYALPTRRPRGVVVHDTGTDGSTINDEVQFMKQNYRSTGVFVHTFIDADEILNIASTKYMAEGAGPKANPYYVQFEMPHETSARTFARQLGNAAYYTATTLKQNNLPVIKGKKNGSGTVWTHYMVSYYLGGTDHEDPNDYWTTAANKYFGTNYNINDFVQLVQAYYNRI